ncbi:MAG: M67 family metallopeptidase [Nitrospirae bacterium]|nr:M67 family metallopeptidase [Nitrospirota bacterium]
MLTIPKHFIDDIISHAKEAAPLECCGILAGKDGTVTDMYKMNNTENDPDKYLMDAKEQFAVVKDIRAKGIDMLAIYHSHPHSPARPSGIDTKLAFYPDAIYIIISLQDSEMPVIKGFLIRDGKVEETAIKIN